MLQLVSPCRIKRLFCDKRDASASAQFFVQTFDIHADLAVKIPLGKLLSCRLRIASDGRQNEDAIVNVFIPSRHLALPWLHFPATAVLLFRRMSAFRLGFR